MPQKPELVIMVGVPCSGKSTYVKNNLDITKYQLLSSDNILEDFAKKEGITYNEAFKKYYPQAKALFYKQFVEASAKGQNIIVDRTSLNIEERAVLLKQASKHQAVCFDFKIDYETAMERNQKRASTGKFIPEETLKKMFAKYQKPSFDEGFARIVTIDAFGKTLDVAAQKQTNLVKNQIWSKHQR